MTEKKNLNVTGAKNILPDKIATSLPQFQIVHPLSR